MEAVAEDCASFAFLQLCRRQPERRGATPAWLRTVARREAYAWHRRNKRFPSLDEGALNETRGEGDMQLTSAADLIRASVDVELAFQAREALRSLAGLGDRRRVALTLQVAGYRYAEIQQQLGVTFTWVNRHVSEARAKLRRDANDAQSQLEARLR